MQNNLVAANQSFIDKVENNDANEYYTIIEINEKIYGIKAKNVLEIVKVMELDYLNKMPSCILGIIEYEQAPISVIDLREVFKNKRITYDLSAKILILKTEETVVSIICDKVLDIEKLNKEKIHNLPYQKQTDFYEGLYINNDENIYILSVGNIVRYIDNNPDLFGNRENETNYIVDDEQSKKILAERKNFLANVAEEVPVNTPLYDRGVSFIINNIKYYINMASVKEFFKVNNSKFIKVPNTPDYIFGLINIKGDYITVIDIRRFFNTSKTEIKEKSTIIILNSSDYKVGILADEICESMNVDFEEILQNRLSSQEENKMLEFVKDGEIYQVLDAEKLFQDERLTIC